LERVKLEMYYSSQHTFATAINRVHREVSYFTMTAAHMKLIKNKHNLDSNYGLTAKMKLLPVVIK
jgi:hypothetical protein